MNFDGDYDNEDEMGSIYNPNTIANIADAADQMTIILFKLNISAASQTVPRFAKHQLMQQANLLNLIFNELTR